MKQVEHENLEMLVKNFVNDEPDFLVDADVLTSIEEVYGRVMEYSPIFLPYTDNNELAQAEQDTQIQLLVWKVILTEFTNQLSSN